MESTAQYGKPVWQALAGSCALFLGQAHSHRAPRGRKRDFADGERLVRRPVAGEWILSLVPNAEQRLCLTMTRTKHPLTRDKVRIHNQMEFLLEDARIQLSGQGSDLLGVNSRRILRGIAEGDRDATKLAAMADRALRATGEELQDALRAVSPLSSQHREILKLLLARLDLMESHIEILDNHIASALPAYHAAVQRLAEVPGYGNGFSATGDRGGRSQRRIVSLATTTGLVGGDMSRAGGIGRSLQEQSKSQRELEDAASSESGGQCGGEVEREYVTERVPPAGSAYGA